VYFQLIANLGSWQSYCEFMPYWFSALIEPANHGFSIRSEPNELMEITRKLSSLYIGHENLPVGGEFQKSRGEYQDRTSADTARTRDNVGTNAWRFRLILELVANGFAGSN